MTPPKHILWAGRPSELHVDTLRIVGQVTVAADLLEAMRAANETDFDTAIIDVEGLKDTTLTLFKHLRSRASRRYLPVLFWSAGPSPDARVRALLEGADDALDATVPPRELSSRVLHGLALRARIDALLNETERLYELSLTDGLTTVANHRHFQDRLGDEFRRAQRYDDPLSLVLIDLDHFKKVNDDRGHMVGDQVLKDVATAIKKSVRETDFVARYGGEEFAVVLPKTTVAGALTVAERVWADLGQLAHGQESDPFTVTASLGLAGYPSRSITTVEQLIRAADESLYRAKREGRNKIALHQAPPLTGTG